MSGYFIVVEGIDGSGKSTLCKNISNVIEGFGKKVLLTYEPYSNSTVLKVKQVLENGINEKSVDKLIDVFYEDRKKHYSKVIKPLLDMGYCIICDRYKLSSILYQTAMVTKDLSTESIEDMNKRQMLIDNYFKKIISKNDSIPDPDLTLFIDIDSIEISHRQSELPKRVDEKFDGKFDNDLKLQKEIDELYIYFLASNQTEKICKKYKIDVICGEVSKFELLIQALNVLNNRNKFKEFINV